MDQEAWWDFVPWCCKRIRHDLSNETIIGIAASMEHFDKNSTLVETLESGRNYT